MVAKMVDEDLKVEKGGEKERRDKDEGKGKEWTTEVVAPL